MSDPILPTYDLSAATARLTQSIVSLDNFKIEGNELGSGAFGTVFGGLEVNPPKREVAVKYQRPFQCRGGQDSSYISRLVTSFFREVFIQTSVEHPALVPFVGWNVRHLLNDNKKVIEFVSVTERMPRTLEPPPKFPALSPTGKAIAAYGIARGMAYLHSLRILHRDLKPANVFLDSKGRPRIADFGFAKIAVGLEQSVQIGTPLYMAPEVWKSETYSFPADVYSFAMILYVLLEDKTAFLEGRLMDTQTLRNRVREGERPSLKKTPEPLRRLLAQLWTMEPQERLTFQVIARKLEKRKYWLPNADEREFAAYKKWLDEEEGKLTKKSFSPDWLKDFDGVELNSRAVWNVLAIAGNGNSAAQVGAALLNLTGAVGAVNVCEAVKLVRDLPNALYLMLLNKYFSEGTALMRGAIAEHEERIEEAARLYKEAAAAGEREGILRYGRLLLNYGKEADGVAVLEIAAEDGDPRANYTLGEWFFRIKKDYGMALRYFEECVKLPEVETYPEPWLMAGKTAVMVRNVEAAREYFSKAINVADAVRAENLVKQATNQLSVLPRPKK
jgi:serine/threonine protein kinase